MKIGIVGYQGSGKSTLFQWLTDAQLDPSKAHLGQAAMTAIPDDRIEQLCEIYQPKKITRASLELLDTPGLSRDHEGNASRLAVLREAGCLIVVVAAFDGTDPLADLASFDEDLLLADLDIVTGRVERLRDSVRRPRPNRDQEIAELEALEPVLAALEEGVPLHEIPMTDPQRRATSSFRLLTEKPKLVVINTADDEENPEKIAETVRARETTSGKPEDVTVVAIPIGIQLELAKLSEEDRAEMFEEMGLEVIDRSHLIQQALDASRQMLFFTAGEKEVRTWLLPRGGTAVEAAGSIHTDLARGFIRAEVIQCADLVQLGSEREVKAANLARQEPKDYIIQEGDVLNIKFSV